MKELLELVRIRLVQVFSIFLSGEDNLTEAIHESLPCIDKFLKSMLQREVNWSLDQKEIKITSTAQYNSKQLSWGCRGNPSLRSPSLVFIKFVCADQS